MSEATPAARTLLWEWASELDDPDPEQRAWKVVYCDGLLEACEETGLLAADEIDAWRRLYADGAAPPAAAGDREAANRHLESLLSAVPPMSRNPEPAALGAWRRFDGALAALHAAGILGDDDERDSRARVLAAGAPWLAEDDVAQLSQATGDAYAISIPPASPAEAAADAALRELDAIGRRGHAIAVFAADRIRRHDGLAIVAVVRRSDSTEVVFHHVGAPQGDAGGHAGREAFRVTIDALRPPALEDDAGTVYQPVSERPVAAHGTGGTPDPMRPRVITGAWRYQPAAPETAAVFDAGVGAAHWRLRARGG